MAAGPLQQTVHQGYSPGSLVSHSFSLSFPHYLPFVGPETDTRRERRLYSKDRINENKTVLVRLNNDDLSSTKQIALYLPSLDHQSFSQYFNGRRVFPPHRNSFGFLISRKTWE